MTSGQTRVKTGAALAGRAVKLFPRKALYPHSVRAPRCVALVAENLMTARQNMEHMSCLTSVNMASTPSMKIESVLSRFLGKHSLELPLLQTLTTAPGERQRNLTSNDYITSHTNGISFHHNSELTGSSLIEQKA